MPLSPKAYELLEALVGRRPRAVSKQEIHDILWPKTFVSESSLTRLMAELRAALGDDAAHPRFVRTVHRFGYAFFGQATAEVNGLVVNRGAGCRVRLGNREIPLGEGENIVGRDETAAVFVDSPRVSRHHARIRVRDGRAVIEDLGSKNGTCVGGQRVEGTVDLADGDEIALGPVFLTFRSGRPAGSTETQSSASGDAGRRGR